MLFDECVLCPTTGREKETRKDNKPQSNRILMMSKKIENKGMILSSIMTHHGSL
jgi:hypothetical protein